MNDTSARLPPAPAAVLVLSPAVILAVAAVWCFSFNIFETPLPRFWLALLGLAYGAACFKLYAGERLEVKFSRRDLGAGALLVVLNVLAHLRGLPYSLGGDELYHSERAVGALVILRDALAPTIDALSTDAYRASMWRLFDLRHMAVIDIWRTGSFVLLAALAAMAAACRGSSRKIPTTIWWSAGIACAILGAYVALAPESHPPLRLAPLTVSTLIFGLNNFAFRLPGVLAVSAAAWALYLYMRRRLDGSPVFPLVVSAATCFIPSVWYVAEAVEPSVFGYLTYIAVLLCTLSFTERRGFTPVILASVAASLGVLFRQSTIALFSGVGVMFLCSGQLRRPLRWAQVALPALLPLPYLLSVAKLGHTATNVPGDPIERLIESIVGGVGIMSALNTATLPWALVFVLALVVAMRRAKWRELAGFGYAVPAYAVFFTVWPYLWGIGRYQAEYVAPFIVLAMLLAAVYSGRVVRSISYCLLPLLMAGTLELNTNLSLDTNYDQWPRMRVTTSANFPYRDALGYLKRADTGGRFLFLGGSPWYDDIVLWLSGFSFSETARWHGAQDEFGRYIAADRSVSELRAFCSRHHIRHVVVQEGTRREQQHRTPSLDRLIRSITLPAKRTGFLRVMSFSGEHGGILTIYAAGQ